MARSHGRIMAAIWNDPDFLALPSEPQRLYMFLLSQPDLSHAGLLPLRVRRWAKKVQGGTVDSINAALDALSRARFIVMDEDTEECLIRTFVRNDGVYKQPKVMLRMREDAQQIESAALRVAFVAELDRLPIEELSDRPGGPKGDLPSTKAVVTGVVETLRHDFADALVGVSGTPADGYAEPTRVRACALPLPPSPYPQPPRDVPTTTSSAHADAARTQSAPGDESTSTLIAEWIDHCPDRPPRRVIGQVSKEIKQMLTEGIPYEHVRRGVVAWHERALHPSTLASVVHELRNPATATRSNGRPTTDDRVRGALTLAQQLRDEEQQTFPQIGA